MTFQISIDDMPNEHNRVRKIDNLFESCIDTYQRLKKIDRIVKLILKQIINFFKLIKKTSNNNVF